MAYKISRDMGMWLIAFGLLIVVGAVSTAVIAVNSGKQPAISKIEQEQPANGLNCSTVKIIYPNIDRNETLLEKVGEGPQLRMLRQGLFGSVGDVFKFCEKAE